MRGWVQEDVRYPVAVLGGPGSVATRVQSVSHPAPILTPAGRNAGAAKTPLHVASGFLPNFGRQAPVDDRPGGGGGGGDNRCLHFDGGTEDSTSPEQRDLPRFPRLFDLPTPPWPERLLHGWHSVRRQQGVVGTYSTCPSVGPGPDAGDLWMSWRSVVGETWKWLGMVGWGLAPGGVIE
ncbi:hypothetical protein MAPG_03300 [Magnaporthiopsis poae ATCC 64411]|uniref:Uncharacterized protein n=1 Tax=Magnaporthiopsis poae (strain ATCC 64411 / 73-15) TaxID=644358 RepID=A0A0C4DTM9_MAGP6|nr:hypothetical protein MAPG_03300 [Magnaporthiopsis poae ATCC 64411]